MPDKLVINPAVSFIFKDNLKTKHLVDLHIPTSVVPFMFNLNESLVLEKKLGLITHNFTKKEADMIAASEFIHFN